MNYHRPSEKYVNNYICKICLYVYRNSEILVTFMFKHFSLIAQVRLMLSSLHFCRYFSLFTSDSYNVSKTDAIN